MKCLVVTSLPTKRISAISQWKTFITVLPTRWRRKPAGIEITLLSPYVTLTHSMTVILTFGRRICQVKGVLKPMLLIGTTYKFGQNVNASVWLWCRWRRWRAHCTAGRTWPRWCYATPVSMTRACDASSQRWTTAPRSSTSTSTATTSPPTASSTSLHWYETTRASTASRTYHHNGAASPRATISTQLYFTQTSNNTAVKELNNVPSALWRCWLGGRKGIRPVKKL